MTGCNLSRSVSSVGEHQSDHLINPQILLPKRAETFGGFDHNAAALARLLQKFTNSTDNVLQSNNLNISTTSTATITTCSPTISTTVLDKPLDKSEVFIDKHVTIVDEEVEMLEQKAEQIIEQSDEKLVIEKKVIKDDKAKDSKSTSPSILVNTVLPIQDPNDTLSTLQLLLGQFEHNRGSVDSELSLSVPQSKHDQIIHIVELQHQLNLLLCLFHHQQTLFELMRLSVKDANQSTTATNINQQQQQTQSLQSTLTNTLSTTRTITISPSTNSSPTMHPNTSPNINTSILPPASSLNKKFTAENQLEELRNLHEKFSEEKQSFEKRTKELDRREEMLKKEKEDLKEQRENLYRKLENIQDELGICMISGSGVPTSAKLANIQASLDLKNDELLKSSLESDMQQKERKSSIASTRPVRNRLSSGDLQVKQQIPLKLAALNSSQQLTSKSCNNSPNISPISPSITFDTAHSLQSNQARKSSFVNYSSSSTTPSSLKSIKVVQRKESSTSTQSSNQADDQSMDDKNEEEIFC